MMGDEHHSADGSDERRELEAAVLGRYQIVRMVGAGGTGVVFLARDTRLHRMVAIKTLRLDLAADASRREEFLREARLTAHLQHDGIAPVHDIIETPAIVASVMRYVGESLATHLARSGGTLAPAEVCSIMIDIVDTMVFVHRRGVLHRDLKPENVLLESGHDRLHARLTDFGIAMVPMRDYGMTGQPVAAGTPGFVSPEQIFSVRDTDQRSDIFALGALAYRLCAGVPAKGIGVGPKAPEYIAPLRDIAPSVPADLARIIERCLAIDPTDRWPDAATLLKHLQRYRRSFESAGVTPKRDVAPLESSSFFRKSLMTNSFLSSLPGIVADAWRSLRRSPAFAGLVIGTLALGIGANATMFAVLDEFVLRPPKHVVQPEKLYTPSLSTTAGQDTFTNTAMSYRSFAAMAHDTSVFSGVTTFALTELSLGSGESARAITGMAVSGDYFRVFGTPPARGRLLVPEDDVEGSTSAVISEGFWKRSFGGRADVVGQSLELNNVRYVVVGVVPRGFAGMRAEAADVWIPLSSAPISARAYNGWRENLAIWLHVVARVRPGVSPAQAAAVATTSIRDAYPITRSESTTGLVTLAPILPKLDSTLEPESKVAVLLAAVSLFVLLTACANVANVTLARNIRRAGDLTMRQVLGITRTRLAALLFTEAVILSAIGGACALAIMYVGGPLLLRFLQDNPDAQLVLDARTALIALGVSFVAAVAAGLAPALSVREDFGAAMRAGSRTLSRGGRTARYALLGVQCASCAVLLTGAGLFARSLHNVASLDVGFDPKNVWSGQISLSAAGFDSVRGAALMHEVQERARKIPGVSHVALSTNTPLSNWAWGTKIRVPGIDSLPRFKDGGPYYTAVGPEFFDAMGARILRGRGIEAADRAVVVINESIAKAWFPNTDPIGQCIVITTTGVPCSTIIGIVADMRRQKLLENDGTAMVYTPVDQSLSEASRTMVLVRATPGTDPTAELRKILQTAAPGLPFADVSPLENRITQRSMSWNLGRTLFGVFGALTLIIAAIGIYGVFSFAVAQRKREIGIRIALGALSHRVLGMVLGEGAAVAAAGAIIGTVGALLAAPLVAPLLFKVSATEPAILIGSALTVLAISVLACLIPARRATRVEPVIAMKAE